MKIFSKYILMNKNVVKIENWLNDPKSLKVLDRKLDRLVEQLRQLKMTREQYVNGIESLLNDCITYGISPDSSQVKEVLEEAAAGLSLSGAPNKINDLSDIIQLIEEVDVFIAEKERSVTEKRLQALCLKWQMLGEN
jgi:hypothetical protein